MKTFLDSSLLFSSISDAKIDGDARGVDKYFPASSFALW